jgi:hypothetical protein
MKTAIKTWIEENSGYPKKAGQIEKATKISRCFPNAVIIQCADEKTGKRFGRAKKRAGFCEKIGSCTFKYQLWASWSIADKI